MLRKTNKTANKQTTTTTTQTTTPAKTETTNNVDNGELQGELKVIREATEPTKERLEAFLKLLSDNNGEFPDSETAIKATAELFDTNVVLAGVLPINAKSNPIRTSNSSGLYGIDKPITHALIKPFGLNYDMKCISARTDMPYNRYAQRVLVPLGNNNMPVAVAACFIGDYVPEKITLGTELTIDEEFADENLDIISRELTLLKTVIATAQIDSGNGD